MFLIASTLWGKGIVPCLIILNPRYSRSFPAKKDFSTFTLNPFCFNLLNALSILLMWYSKYLLLIINRSSIYVVTYSRPLNNLYIFA